jgi:hypothetical protein
MNMLYVKKMTYIMSLTYILIVDSYCHLQYLETHTYIPTNAVNDMRPTNTAVLEKNQNLTIKDLTVIT